MGRWLCRVGFDSANEGLKTTKGQTICPNIHWQRCATVNEKHWVKDKKRRKQTTKRLSKQEPVNRRQIENYRSNKPLDQTLGEKRIQMFKKAHSVCHTHTQIAWEKVAQAKASQNDRKRSGRRAKGRRKWWSAKANAHLLEKTEKQLPFF